MSDPSSSTSTAFVPARNFVDRIAKAIVACDVVIAVIGPHWIGRSDDGKPTRLEDPADSVRFEIETALKHNKTLLPLLVNGATMPEAAELPESLRFLHFCNAARVDSGQDFRMHMTRLIDTINEVPERSRAIAAASGFADQALLGSTAQALPPPRWRWRSGPSGPRSNIRW